MGFFKKVESFVSKPFKSIGGIFGNMLGTQKVQGGEQFQLTAQEMAARNKLLDQMLAQSQGKDSSFNQFVGAQQQRALGQLQEANLGQAASMRGVSPALAMRQAQMSTQDAASDIANQALIAKQQQREAAQQNLGNFLTNRQQNAMDLAKANAEASAASRDRGMNFLGNIGGALVQKYSDENLKKDIKKEDKKLKSFLDEIEPSSWSYKEGYDDVFGEKKHFGPMAQELEKSEVGKSMVKETPLGKVVDYGSGFASILASQAALNERLKELEKKKKG